jgi:predicted nicotinamide N-methyase
MSKEISPAPPPEVILPRLGPIVREKVLVQGQTFLIERPSQSDKLLDAPEVTHAFALDEYMPYWAEIWPAARMLAKVLLRESFAPGQLTLEMGCGLGVAGVVALSRGAHVVFTDYDLCALHFAARNARLNGFDNFQTRQIDWRHPPDDLRVPCILASDLIYEVRNVVPVVRFMKTVLLPGGTCLMTDQDRIPAELFRTTLAEEGLKFTTEFVRAGEPGGRRLKGTLYRITNR